MDQLTQKRLIRDSSILLVIIIITFFLQYGLNILLARWLKAELYGDYSVAMTVVQFCATLVLLGSDSSIMYFLPAYIAKENWGKAHGYLRHFANLILRFSIGILVLWVVLWGGAMLLVHAGYLQFHHIHVILFSLWLVPLLGIVSFLTKLLRSFNKVYLSLIPSSMGYPIFLIGIVLLLIGITGHLNIYQIFFAVGFVMLIIVIIQLFCIKQIIPQHLLQEKPRYEQNLWLKVSLQLMISGLVIYGLQGIDLITLEIVGKGEAEVGIFSALITICNALWLIYQAISVVFSPLISPLIKVGDRQKLQALYNTSVLVKVFPLLLLTLLLLVFGKSILNHFGSDFTSAYKELVIMVVGTAIVIIMNMPLLMLQYSGQQASLLRLLLVLLVVSIILNVIFILSAGLMGAVISLIASSLLLCISCAVLVKERIGIRPLIIY